MPAIVQFKNNKRLVKLTKQGVIFGGSAYAPVNTSAKRDESKKVTAFINQRTEKKSMDADVSQKRVGSSEALNPAISSDPERY